MITGNLSKPRKSFGTPYTPIWADGGICAETEGTHPEKGAEEDRVLSAGATDVPSKSGYLFGKEVVGHAQRFLGHRVGESFGARNLQ